MDYIEYIKDVLVPISVQVHKFMDSTRVIAEDSAKTRENIDYLMSKHSELNRYWNLSKLAIRV